MFKPGNTYGKLTKRGINKTAKETKELINKILFNEEEFTEDWQQMDVHARMELRIKMARFIIPEPKEATPTANQTDIPLFLNSPEEMLGIFEQLDLTEEQLIQNNDDKARDL
tara:strand:- start:738 stop:1073 length:336 start_codon:yes stop_codon:yes gene_type:complete